jgi:hypothetical protein
MINAKMEKKLKIKTKIPQNKYLKKIINSNMNCAENGK